jgi:PRTRC genetic system protein B
MATLLTSFKPKAQIVLYSADKGEEAYLEYRDIRNVGGKEQLGEGKPLTRNSLQEMLGVVLAADKTQIATLKQLLPSTVLYVDGRPGRNRLVWYTPAMRRNIHIEGTGKKIKKGMVWVPAMLYAVAGETLNVFAMATGTKRPEPGTKLYNAPLPNVYNEGNVCMGNVKKPAKIVEISELIAAWDKAFWNSEFTHDVAGNTRLKSKKPTAQLIKRLMRTRGKFPIRELVLSGKSIQSLVSKL